LAARERIKRGRSWWIIGALVLVLFAGGVLLVLGRLRPRPQLLYQKGTLYLQSGNVDAALEYFRSALERNPHYLDAQRGIVRALAVRRDFEEAEGGVAKAEQMGLSEADAALLRAKLYAMRGNYRMQSAGRAADIGLCESVIEKDIKPAIELVEKYADTSEDPALGRTELGDLYVQKSRVLGVKWRLLREARDLARDLNQNEEAAARNAEALALIPEIGEAQQRAMRAYSQAIKLNPESTMARLAIARHALSTYVPRPDSARAVLEPIIQRDPQHREARQLLAVTERMTGNYDKALEHINAIRKEGLDEFDLLLATTGILVDAERWEEAGPPSEMLIKMKPGNPQAAYLRGRVLMEQGHFEEAANHLQNIFARSRTPWPRARFALAQALQKSGMREQAVAAFKQVLNDISATMVTNVRVGRERKEILYKSSMALASELMDESPQAAAEHAVRAFGLFPDRREAFEAAKRARKAAGSPPKEIEDLLLLHAAALAAAGDINAGLAACQRAIEESGTAGSRDRTRLLRARLLVRKGAYREAAEAYQALRTTFPDKRPAYELATLHVRLGHYAEARKIYEDLLQVNKGDARAIGGLVSVLVRTGDMAGARTLLEQVYQEEGSERVRSLLINLYVREGQTEEALALARSRVEAHPESAAVHVALAELQWRLGNLAEARSAFDEALKLEPDFLPAYRRGLLDLQEGAIEKAIALFKGARQRLPDALAPRLHLAIAFQAAGQPQEGVRVLEDTLGSSKATRASASMARWYLAVMYAALGNTEAAASQNSRISLSQLGLRTDRLELLSRLAALGEKQRQKAASAANLAIAFSRSGSVQPALEKIQAVEKLLPGEPLPPCWHMSLLDREGKHEEAVEMGERIIQEHPGFVFARILLADSHARYGDAEGAVRALDEALPYASEEQAAVLQFRLGQMYEEQNRIEEATSSYEAAMKHPAMAPYACNNLAWILATRKKDTTAALRLAEQALKLGGSRPEILDTLGWIHCLNGNTEEALKYLEAAKKRLPQVPTVRYHLGVAYMKAGRQADAKAELEEALSISSSFPEATEAARLLKSL